MTAPIRHLRRADYLEMPWRNGQGSTLEIARDPAGPGEFNWRLSLATISVSGPFSLYSGYQRGVSLIEGNGFVLHIEKREPVRLLTAGATAIFPGAATTGCELVSGTSTDLSLMVREPGTILSVTRETCDIVHSFAAVGDALQAFFCLDEGLALDLNDSVIPLARHDTIVVPADGAGCRFSTQQIAAQLLRLVWRLD